MASFIMSVLEERFHCPYKDKVESTDDLVPYFWK